MLKRRNAEIKKPSHTKTIFVFGVMVGKWFRLNVLSSTWDKDL